MTASIDASDDSAAAAAAAPPSCRAGMGDSLPSPSLGSELMPWMAHRCSMGEGKMPGGKGVLLLLCEGS